MDEQDVAALTQALLRRAAAAAGAFAERSGLHPTDRRALQLLDEVGSGEAGGTAVTPGRLAERLNLSPAATTALVDRLAAAGLVERVRDLPDRRQVRLRLTDRARRLGQEVLAPLARRIGAASAGLSPAEAATVAGFLTAVLDPPGDPSPMSRIGGRTAPHSDPCDRPTDARR